jgi:hypothetical protein
MFLSPTHIFSLFLESAPKGRKDLNSSLLLFPLCLFLFRGFSSLSYLSWGFICRHVQLIPPESATLVSWLLYRAGGFLLNVCRLLPSIGGRVLVPLFFAVSNLDYFSASITSLISDGCCCSQVRVHTDLPYFVPL